MKADLDALRASLGTVSNISNTLLEGVLETATASARERVMVDHFDHPEVQQGILFQARRLYKRAQSPEGVAGWGDLGVIRVADRDPDAERLFERHIDYFRVGVA